MNPEKNKKIIISGGGTGGHVFPAIAIANAIKRLQPDTEILFVGANGRMEMEKVPQAGYKIVGFNIAGFQRSFSLKNFSFPFKVLASLRQAKKIIKEFSPDAVIGVGGYASGPVLRVATKMKIPTLIQEQNSYPGITNKILSKKVHRICVAYEGMEKFFPADKIVLTGNPVREEVTKIKDKRQEALEYFKLDDSKKIILSVGGSLGALTINECIQSNIELLKQNQIQMIWQTGKSFFSKAEQTCISENHSNVKPHQFISRMDLAYAAADIIISRAGAIAISELCIVGKPLILVPSPNVAEDHQTKNAMALTVNNAAIMVKDAEARVNLFETAIKLLNNPEKMNELQKNIKTFARTGADDKIAALIFEMIR